MALNNIQNIAWIKSKRQHFNEEGFTLVELIIVVVIIGILAAIAIPIYMNQQRVALQATVITDVKNSQIEIATGLAKIPNGNVLYSCATGDTSGYTLISPTFDPSHAKKVLVPLKASDTNTKIEVWGGAAGSGSYTIRAINHNALVIIEYDSSTDKSPNVTEQPAGMGSWGPCDSNGQHSP